MTALVGGLATLSLLLLAWSYLIYPALIIRLAGSRAGAGEPSRAPDESAPGSVEVVISAADEEDVIEQRVVNLLDQEFAGRYRIAIGCDGSADRTAERARAAGDARLRVLEFPARRGKAAVLNDLVASSDADLLVFSDANTRFEPEAIARLAQAFHRPDVGAACGRLLLEGSDVESSFWDRETAVKEAEGRLGVCLGANGAIYAARRRDVSPLPEDTTSMDDFLIPLHAARRGRRIVFIGDAVAREPATRQASAEMGRRFRIGIGAGQVLRRERWLWNVARHGLLSLAFLSRKAARWLCPVAALGAVVLACASSQLWPVGAAAAGAIAVLLLCARFRASPGGWMGRLYYFVVINLALAAGVLAGLVGSSRPVWKPVPRGRG